MEIEILKRVIESQRDEIQHKFGKEQMVERENKEYALGFLKHPNILAILGVRRCGKSIFTAELSRALNQKSGYFNFDDERLAGLSSDDLDKILQAFYELYGDVEVVILDEIQNIKGWELFANRLRRTKKVIITGSNSKMLSGELATHLTGRYIDMRLYPFSFRESLVFKPNVYLTSDVAKTRNALREYLSGSGFPEYRDFGSAIVIRIYEDIVHKDCIKRYKIKEETAFREMANYLASNFSNEFTYSKLSRLFGLKDVHTAKNYVKYLEEAYLLIALERFSHKLKQQVIAPKKAYNVDHGLCNFIGFKVSPDKGRLIENAVCVELMRRKALDRNMKVYYWKDHQQNEVDFVVKDGAAVRQLLQVCYDIGKQDVKEREISSLLKAGKELRCSNLIVITDDYEAEEKAEGKKVRYFPLWKWLLEAVK